MATLYSITIYTVLYKNKNNFEALFHLYYFIKPIETQVGPSITEDLSTEWCIVSNMTRIRENATVMKYMQLQTDDSQTYSSEKLTQVCNSVNMSKFFLTRNVSYRKHIMWYIGSIYMYIYSLPYTLTLCFILMDYFILNQQMSTYYTNSVCSRFKVNDIVIICECKVMPIFGN